MISKAYADAVGAELMSSMIDSIPTGLMSLGMRVVATTGLTSKAPMPHMIITNVPGPQFPLYFCGAKASLGMGVGCVMDGAGLFHTVTSYNGYLSVTFLSCKTMMFYHQCINRSFKEHLSAAEALTKPRAKAANAKPKSKPAAKSKPRPKRKAAAKKPTKLQTEK